jgi:hypothetical protein
MNKTSETNILNTFENVSILQGGGSLSAFGYGEFKALAKCNIKLDISQALQLADCIPPNSRQGNLLAMILIDRNKSII